MTLGETQEEFSRDLAMLILWAYAQGYAIRMGEVLRSKEQAQWNVDSGKGIADSNHLRKLAADLNLFRDGQYMAESSDHVELGKYWKSLHPDNVWGGDFKRRDGNHYSRRYKGYAV